MKRANLRRAAVLCAFAYAVVAGALSANVASVGRPSPVVSGSSRPGTAPARAGFRLAVGQNQAPTVRPWPVIASRYKFTPPRIEVVQDDVVKIELRTDDIAHSLTIDAYRIAKRVNPGQPITFEFRADQIGTFPFYCNLQIDDGCRQMHGELVVKARK
ncbi:MAG: cupredoxin domain-containing protein [Acidobacteriota bacterium]